jgi:hypothetical protein
MMQFKRLGFLSLGVFALFIISTPSFSQTWPYYVLDGYGGVHAGGGAATISPATPYFGWDIAKGIDYFAVANSASNYGHGILVLDGYGGVHKGGKLLGQSISATPYFGWDIARDIVARIIPPRAAYSSYSSANTEVTSSSYVSIRSVTLYLPDDSYVLITGTCSLGNNHATDYVWARVALGVDGLTALDNLEAEHDLPSANHTHNWFNITRTQMTFVTAGSHTFYFLLRKMSGTGQVLYFSPHISVISIDQGYYGTSHETTEDSTIKSTGNIK